MTRSTPDRFSRVAKRIATYIKKNQIKISSDPANLQDKYWNVEGSFYYYQLPKSRGSKIIAAYCKPSKILVYNENGIEFSIKIIENKQILSITEKLNVYEL